MAHPKTILDDIKKDLAKAGLKDRPTTTKEIIEGLAEDIHRHLRKGARLDEVYEIIRARLPDDNRLTLTTFRKYWRDSRDLAGLSKIKNSGRKKNTETTSVRTEKIHVVKRTETENGTPKRTSNEFREDPDNI